MDDQDDGNPSRGIVYGLLFALPFWLAVAVVILLVNGCAHCAWFCSPFIRG